MLCVGMVCYGVVWLNVRRDRTKHRKVHKVPQSSTRYRKVDNNTARSHMVGYLIPQGTQEITQGTIKSYVRRT